VARGEGLGIVAGVSGQWPVNLKGGSWEWQKSDETKPKEIGR